MANARFQFSVKDRSLEGLFKRMAALVTRKMRSNFTDVRPIVEKSIDESVAKHKNKFIPDAGEIAELGVGSDGSPDPRSQVAWLELEAKNAATNLSVRKKGTEGSSTIGEIKISIDEEIFYKQHDSIIETPDSDEISEIPWMRWLIEGHEIGDSSFDSNIIRGASRTGRGIMIKGGLWSIQGRGAEIYDRILNDARLAINRNLKKTEGVSILRKLR